MKFDQNGKSLDQGEAIDVYNRYKDKSLFHRIMGLHVQDMKVSDIDPLESVRRIKNSPGYLEGLGEKYQLLDTNETSELKYRMNNKDFLD